MIRRNRIDSYSEGVHIAETGVFVSSSPSPGSKTQGILRDLPAVRTIPKSGWGVFSRRYAFFRAERVLDLDRQASAWLFQGVFLPELSS